MKGLFKHVSTEEYLLLIKTRSSGVNTFLQVDNKGNPIVKKGLGVLGQIFSLD